MHSSTSARARGRRAGEMAPQPLGRELDRRERVLDLVRQAARDLAPRGDLLRADERRHVVQHQHHAFVRAAVADERRGDDGQMHLLPFAHDRDLLRDRLGDFAARRAEERAERLEVWRARTLAGRLAHHCARRGRAGVPRRC